MNHFDEHGGCLFVVATPIGNLEDITQRAARILGDVDLILAEDTRRTARLLAYLGIDPPLKSLHQHNERAQSQAVLEQLRAGKRIALVSDAGTPLVSDPGYVLVKTAREAGLKVVPVPGASAVTTALSAAGLPTDRFVFEGFLPTRRGPRVSRLQDLATEPRTIVFFEAPHRIVETLADAQEVFGEGRTAVVARELTKRFETIRSGTLAALLQWMRNNEDKQRGEFVLLVAGAPEPPPRAAGLDAEQLLRALLAELPPGKAAAVAAKCLGANKRELYELALKLNDAGRQHRK